MAAFAVAAVDNPLAVNQHITLGGPASYTWTEIIHEVGRAIGSQLPVQYLPAGSRLPLIPGEASNLLNYLETYESYVDMSETAQAFGIKLTPLNDYIFRTFVQPVRA